MMIGDYSTTAHGWITVRESIGAPAPRIRTVNLLGVNGSVNLSAVSTGKIMYDDRTLTVVLQRFIHLRDRQQAWTALQQYHGQEWDVCLDSDPLYTYHGIVTVGELSRMGSLGEITIKVQAQPYKSRIWEKRNIITWAGKSQSFTLTQFGAVNGLLRVEMSNMSIGVGVSYNGESFTGRCEEVDNRFPIVPECTEITISSTVPQPYAADYPIRIWYAIADL